MIKLILESLIFHKHVSFVIWFSTGTQLKNNNTITVCNYFAHITFKFISFVCRVKRWSLQLAGYQFVRCAHKYSLLYQHMCLIIKQDAKHMRLYIYISMPFCFEFSRQVQAESIDFKITCKQMCHKIWLFDAQNVFLTETKNKTP